VAGISAGLLIDQRKRTVQDDYIVFHGHSRHLKTSTEIWICKVSRDGPKESLRFKLILSCKVCLISIIRDALELTRKGRLQIINDVIVPCIAKPREILSEYAPKIEIIDDIPAD